MKTSPTCLRIVTCFSSVSIARVGSQVFARVLSDFTFKAMIFDVIVAGQHRGQGLGQALVGRILNHEKLKRVKSFELYCPDRLVPFYEKLGFVKGTSSLLYRQI